MVLAFVREELDNKLHSAGRHPAMDWEFQCFDYSRHRRSGASASSDWHGRSGWWDAARASTPPTSTQTNNFFLERPNSPEGEAVQALYASIMLSWPGSPPQALLIASGFPGEGKTTVALNLSYALAKQGTDLPGGCRPAKGPAGTRLQPDRRTRG